MTFPNELRHQHYCSKTLLTFRHDLLKVLFVCKYFFTSSLIQLNNESSFLGQYPSISYSIQTIQTEQILDKEPGQLFE